MFKGEGVKSNPREIAIAIISNLPQNDIIQKVCIGLVLAYSTTQFYPFNPENAKSKIENFLTLQTG